MKREIGRLWKLKLVEFVPVVIRTLGSVTKQFNGWIVKLGITYNVRVMQKTALLRTAQILRKVLECKEEIILLVFGHLLRHLTEKMIAMTTGRT